MLDYGFYGLEMFWFISFWIVFICVVDIMDVFVMINVLFDWLWLVCLFDGDLCKDYW